MTDFLKNADGLPVETINPQATFLVAAVYTHSTDESTALTNALAEIEQKLLIFDTAGSGWQTDNGGLLESTTTTGITSVAVGDGATKHPAGTGFTELATHIVITPARAWEETNENPHQIWPIVLFNDQPVPLGDIIKVGDGFTAGDLVIIVNNSAGKYDATASKWKVYFTRPIPGVVEADLGGMPFPQTTESKRLLGFTEPVSKITTNDGGVGSGSITVAEHLGKWEVDNGRGAAGTRELLNNPGEEMEKLIYDAGWTVNALNKVSYQDSSKRLVIAQCFMGNNPRLTGNAAAEQKKVFLKVVLHVGVRVTGIENLQNTSADATDFITRQYSLEWDNLYQRVFRTGA